MFPFMKILCPTDFSEPSLCGMKLGAEMADRFGSEIIIINVHKPIPHLPTPRVQAPEVTFDVTAYEQQIIEDAKLNLAEVSETIFGEVASPRLVVRIGKPADEILALAEEEKVDAIFIATHGRTGLSNVIFGSVAQRVVRRAQCPVLTVRACQ